MVNPPSKAIFIWLFLCLFASFSTVFAGDKEFSGQFDTKLIADKDDTETVIFKFVAPEKLNGSTAFGENAHVSSAKLYNPETEKLSISSILVEKSDEEPLLFVDFNNDKTYSDNEKLVFQREFENDDDYWVLDLNVPMQNSFFGSAPIYLNFLKRYTTDGMTKNDRLMKQSTKAFARGTVDFKGKKLLVQYSYDFGREQISAENCALGVDADGDGEIDMGSTSPEALEVRNETPVFRVGDIYFSTKKADVKKNLIVLTEKQAKDYKRIELVTGKELPDFDFTDFNGKKRKFSEFRGKYVLLDIWGIWCPACRDELPYLREAQKRFQSRNFEILGLNTDEQPVGAIKKVLEQNSILWTQASFESIVELVGKKMMIHTFPTTMLISPEGKIISLNRTSKGELDLRGKDLLRSLDKTLPQ
jgi:thiol-disulfide isomerase/thioredoxin